MSMSGHDPNEPLPVSWESRKLVTAGTWFPTLRTTRGLGRTQECRAISRHCVPYLMSIEHAYANTDRPIPADPWIVVADALNGARFHE